MVTQPLIRCLLVLLLRNFTSTQVDNSFVAHVLLQSPSDVQLVDGLVWKDSFLHRSDAMAGGCWKTGLTVDCCLECLRDCQLGSLISCIVFYIRVCASGGPGRHTCLLKTLSCRHETRLFLSTPPPGGRG